MWQKNQKNSDLKNYLPPGLAYCELILGPNKPFKCMILLCYREWKGDVELDLIY